MRIVVKWGGTLTAMPGRLAGDVANLRGTYDVVVCHGGSRDIDDVSEALQVAEKPLLSPDGTMTRRTTGKVLDAMQMALRGRTQRRIVEALAREGVPTVGLQASDCGAVLTQWKSSVRAVEDGRTVIVRDNFGGRVERVDPTLYELLLDSDIVPVVCPPGATADGVVTNIDADRLAARLAGALGAETLCLLTDQPGLLTEAGDPGSLVPRLTADEAQAESTRVSGGMRLKLIAAVEALEHGVQTVVLADGRRANPIRDALARRGTVIEGGF